MTIQWGLAQQGGFQNALATGMQMGQMARQAQDQREYKNALGKIYAPKAPSRPSGGASGVVATPEQEAESARLASHLGMQGVTVNDGFDPQAMATIMQHNPELGARLQKQASDEQRKRQIGQVAMAAQKGDPDALGQLFTLDPDLWKRFDDQQRDKVKASTSYMAQSAFQVGRLPEEQRAAAWTQAVQQAEASGMDIPAYLEGYSPQALNQALAVAEKTEAYIKQFEPDWRAVPAGGYLENVNPLSNPAVGQGGQGASPQGAVPTISDPEQAKTLPPGSQFYTPDGRLLRVPGGPASASGGFPGGG